MASPSFSFGRTPPSVGFVLLLLFFINGFPSSVATATIDTQPEDRILVDRSVLEDAILDAKTLLLSLGVPESNLCRSEASANHEDDDLWPLPLCNRPRPTMEKSNGLIRSSNPDRVTRFLEMEEEEPTFEEDPWFYLINLSCAVGCVMTAALAAGLTMGMLSLDPLMLLVKIRAARSQDEKDQAKALLPIVKQHHFLLVTLLLLNSMANEALPLFLEVLVSPVMSVVLSVTFVLIFGEILPSAIFTGPKKLELASKMVPIVKGVMILVWPIAYPIAKILDKCLHEDEDDAGGAFDRGEISALVRIQYEERLANKRQRKLERMNTARLKPLDSYRSGPGGSFPHPKPRSPDLEAVLKAAKAESFRHIDRQSSADDFSALSDVQSIHVDEVMMVEGALQMKTKTAMDVFTPIHRMFAVPENLILNEDSIVDIYSSGYSRIPVYEQDPLKPKSQTAIKGLLITKHLIVVNMNEDRPLLTMPLFIPQCVSPKMNLLELVNLFQTGRYGHFALVCARPCIGTEALKKGNAVPTAAGVMGVVTLEDVLEELLQEEIYDENDQMEKEAERIALWVGRKWKRLQRKREMKALGIEESMGSVVEAAVAIDDAARTQKNNVTNSESTSLLRTSENVRDTNRDRGLIGSIFQSLGIYQGGS